MAKAAVFASGRGSNFRAINEYLQTNLARKHEIACLVTDKPTSGAAEYAQSQSIPVICLDYAIGQSRDILEGELAESLKHLGVDLVVLAGFMRIVGATLIGSWPERIINIHPSLLPKYPGRHGIRDSFISGDTWLGITIHRVDQGIDTGPILVQKSFSRGDSDTLEEIEERIHQLEHETYPVIVGSLLESIATANDGGLK